MLPTILLVGLNHKTAPLSVRERAASLCGLCDQIHANSCQPFHPPLFLEHLFLSTCNRTEIYVVTTDCTRAEQQLYSHFAQADASASPTAEYLYVSTDDAAVRHLFAVACGIDSLVLGEFEILGQVRRAYQEAVKQGTVGPILHQLFQSAVRVGKRARAETEIGRGALSVAYAAVALARQKMGDLRGRTALVIGAGKMGRRAAENLSEDGDCTVLVASRTYAHALQLARDIHAQAVPFEQLGTALAQADLVISATRAPHIILDAATVASARQTQPARPLWLIDIAVPRDIDPAVAALDNVQLFNLDDLNEVVSHTRAARAQAVAQVQAIIADEAQAFWQWYLTRRAAPLLNALYARAEAIRQAELDKTLRRLNHLPLTERERHLLHALSISIVNKILAAPTATLKAQLQKGNGQLYLDLVRELFDLPEELWTETK